MGSDIALTSSQRSSLLSLQETVALSSRTQNRLATGKRVNSVVDDAVNFFRARALDDRAADFADRKAGIDQGVSSLQAALTATEAADSILSQLKGIAEAAKSQSDTERAASTEQFVTLTSQLSFLIEDASYAGLNLLNSTAASLDVSFGIRTQSRLSVDSFSLNSTETTASLDRALFTRAGVAFTANGSAASATLFSKISGLATSTEGFSNLGTNNTAVTIADAIVAGLDAARSQLRGFAAQLGSNVALLQTRLTFTNSYVNDISGGSDKLTLADLNEEGANLSALQTRQQLGIQSLSIAGQQQSAILGLIR